MGELMPWRVYEDASKSNTDFDYNDFVGSGNTVNREEKIDKTKFRRCLNYPDPTQYGVMAYGGYWTGDQTTDYWIPYYATTKGLANVFQGQPSIVSKDGKCLYAKRHDKNVGYTFGRGQADSDPKYRKYEKSCWILSKAKTAELLPIIGGVGLVSVSELSFNWVCFSAAMGSNLGSASCVVYSKKVTGGGNIGKNMDRRTCTPCSRSRPRSC